jgi:hypothetical protein
MHAWSNAQLDALTAAYFLAFAVGALFSVVSWLLGCARRGGSRRLARSSPRGAPRAAGGSGVGRPGRIAAVAKPGRVAAAAPARRSPHLPAGALSRVVSPLLDMSAWAAMLCVGGGVGYLLRANGWGAVMSVVVAVPSALAAGYLLGALVEMLRDDTRYIAPASVEGTVATVLRRIGSGTTGEVVFVKSGTRRALPAASADGRAIDLGTEVIVVAYSGGIARVTRADDLLA